VAAALISSLQPGSRIAVMQVNNQIELLQLWTTDQTSAIKSLNQRLSARPVRCKPRCLRLSKNSARSRPGNTHLVLISHGVDNAAKQSDLHGAYNSLIAPEYHAAPHQLRISRSEGLASDSDAFASEERRRPRS
jgi:hypothetical protein